MGGGGGEGGALKKSESRIGFDFMMSYLCHFWVCNYLAAVICGAS